MIERNYCELAQEIEAFLKEAKEIVVATCANDRVTGRTMNHVNDGLTVMVGTRKGSTKVMQMRENSNAALVCGPLQIEATAELDGTPAQKALHTNLNDEKFPWMKEAFPSDEDADDDDSILVMFHPTKITFYKYLDNEAHWDVLDVENQKAYRI